MVKEIPHKDLFLHVLLNLGWKQSEIFEEKSIFIRRDKKKFDFKTVLLGEKESPSLVIFFSQDHYLNPPIGFYQKYLDLDYLIYSIIEKVINKLPSKPNILLIDSNRSYLIESKNFAILLFCNSKDEQIEVLYPFLEKRKVLHGLSGLLSAKSKEEQGRELANWADLWITELGSKFLLKRPFLNIFLKKIIFLRVFEILFPEKIPYLKFSNYLQPESFFESKKSHSLLPSLKPIEKALSDLYYNKGIDFLKLDNQTKFLLDSPEVKSSNLIWRFFSEINLHSLTKFEIISLISAFIPESYRHKSWKVKYSDSSVKIKDEIVTDEVLVLKPLVVDISEIGFEEMLSAFDKTLNFWSEYNQRKGIEKRRGMITSLPLDMFVEVPKYVSESGLIENIVAFCIDYSFRVKTSSQEERDLADFFIYLKILYLIKKLNKTLNVFPSLSKIWI